MEYIVLRYLTLSGLVKEVNVRIQDGWEPLGGIAIEMKIDTVNVPTPTKSGIGRKEIGIRRVFEGVKTIYLQAMFKRKK